MHRLTIFKLQILLATGSLDFHYFLDNMNNRILKNNGKLSSFKFISTNNQTKLCITLTKTAFSLNQVRQKKVNLQLHSIASHSKISSKHPSQKETYSRKDLGEKITFPCWTAQHVMENMKAKMGINCLNQAFSLPKQTCCAMWRGGDAMRYHTGEVRNPYNISSSLILFGKNWKNNFSMDHFFFLVILFGSMLCLSFSNRFIITSYSTQRCLVYLYRGLLYLYYRFSFCKECACWGR